LRAAAIAGVVRLIHRRAGHLRAGSRCVMIIRGGQGRCPILESQTSRQRRCLRACDLGDATGPCTDRKSEAVQLNNGRYQTEAKAQA
jgi:hypothetical protein